MNPDLMMIERPTVAGVPLTKADVRKVWNEMVTIEGWPQDEALAAILRSLHHGLDQLG